MIELTRFYYFIFGVLTVVGGVMGYVKANSKASLIAGGISGLLLIFSGVLISTRTQPGLLLGMLISLALAGRFVRAFVAKGTWMPAGIMATLSVIALLLTILSLIAKR